MILKKCTHQKSYGRKRKCNLRTFEDEDTCIFHCEKTVKNAWIRGEDTSDNSEYKYLWDEDKVNCFWDSLYKYMNLLLKLEKRVPISKFSTFPLSDNDNPLYLSNAIDIGRQGIVGEDISKVTKLVYFQGIKFPPTLNKSNRYIYSKMNDIREFRYAYCHFYDSLIDMYYFGPEDELRMNSEIFLHDCVIEESMVFERFYSGYSKKIHIDSCKIGKNIIFLGEFADILLDNIEVKNIFINSDKNRLDNLAISPTYNKLVIRDSVVETIYTGNKATINELVIKNLKQKIQELILNKIDLKKLYIKNFEIANLSIFNVDLLENSRILFEDLKVDDFKIEKVSQDSKYIQFNNVSVLNKFECTKIEFNNTYFNDFDISNADKKIQKTSFIDSHLNTIMWGNISKINAPKQVFRQLKFVNDKQANYIEANNFYSMEMKKYKEELSLIPIIGNIQDKSIFWINEKMSNFGQSFLKPIGLIIFFSIIYGLIIYGNKYHCLMDIYPKGSEILNTIMHWLNYPLKEFKPLEKILKKDYEFMSLIFNVIFSVLIWQTIVAVKRYTKR